MWKLLRKYNKIWCAFFAFIFFTEIASASLSGSFHDPKEPNMGGFVPIEQSEMVSLFSGDFSYNIPLFEIGGYPINLSYSSTSVSNESEPSWVGLGWNLNPGLVKRDMRGIPDDFSADVETPDKITQRDRMIPNKRYSLGFSASAPEVLGVSKAFDLNLNARVNYFFSTYGGYGFNLGAGLTAVGDQPISLFASKIFPSASLSFDLGTESGISVSPSLGLISEYGKNKDSGKDDADKISSSVGLTFNSRTSRVDKNFNVTSTRNFTQANLGALVGANSMNILTYGSSSISANRTFIPTGFLPIKNEAYSLRFSVGLELFPVAVNTALDGSYSIQSLAGANDYTNVLERDLKPYGYLYYDQNKHYNAKGNSVYDFNRENEFELSEKSPAINLAYTTYDYFTVQAQGLQGSYRFKTNGVDIVSDGNYKLFGENENSLESVNLGVDLGAVASLKIGLNGGAVIATGYQSGWSKSDLPFFNALSASSDKADSKYQRKSIYQIGSTYKINSNDYENLLTDEPFQFGLNELPGNTNSLDELKSHYGLKTNLKGVNNSKSLRSNYHNETRIEQSQPFTYLTAEELKAYNGGFIREYSALVGEPPLIDKVLDSVLSSTTNIKAHHISAAHVTRNDGMQFNFDLPAYNSVYKEVSFNISNGANHLIDDVNLGTYSLEDNLPKSLGTTGFLSEKSIDPYAYAYHLTSILSPDYFDLRGDGPSKDDIGNYVKFEYRQWADAYKWKTPHGRGQNLTKPVANLNENLYSDINDDVGSYVYGVKEIFYVESVHSKDQVAVFYTSENKNLQGLTGEHGSYNSDTTLGKLDSIQIFTLQEYESSRNVPVPEQSIHFVYNYELCKIAGDGTGKLTLKKVFSTFRFQEVSAINSYLFDYGDGDDNPNYNSNNSDRWGNYQQIGYGNVEYETPNFTESIANRNISNTEFPFTSQNKALADLNAGAWLLKSIGLPSGGSIDVEYESDTYSFVQNKRVAKTFPIAGFGVNISTMDVGINQSNLYSGDNKDFKNHNYMFVKLNGENDIEDKQNWYLATQGLYKIPVRCLVDITGEGDFEFVKLYVDVEEVGITNINQQSYGYIKINDKAIKNDRKKGPDRLNQIAKHAMQMAYNKFSKKLNNGTLNPADDSEAENILKGLKGFRKNAENLLNGAINSGLDRNYGRKVILDKSFCVLYCPDGIKFGGGARVKQISMSDNWDEASSDENLTSSKQKETISIWQYNYDNTETIQKDASGAYVERTISSGVAEWEPDNGSIENMCLDPLNIESSDFFEPSGTFFQLKPYGKTIFPSPNVGYSKVTVTKSGVLDNENVAPFIAKEEHQFYTAKEFPVKTSKTNLEFLKAPKSPKSQFKFFNTRDSHLASASQGFSIVLNDMHGKPLKSTYFKGAVDVPYKEVSYKYKTDSNPFEPELKNTKDFINPNGEVISNMVNIDVDIALDSKEYYHKSSDTKVNANLDGILFGFIGFFTLTGFSPTYIQSTFARSLSVTKVVSKYAILDEVITREDGATLLQKDLVFDANSGQPVVSKIQNDYGDDIYSLNIPAYWIYPEFGPRFSRDKMQLGSVSDVLIHGGDILLDLKIHKQIQAIDELGMPLKFAKYIQSTTNGNEDQLELIQDPFLNQNMLVLLSRGNQNRLTLSAARYTLLDNPIGIDGKLFAPNLKALSAEFSVYKKYNVPSDCRACVTSSLGPNHLALIAQRRRFEQGTVKPLGGRYYSIDDTQQNTAYLQNENFDLRKDGTLENFPKFFELTNGVWQTVGNIGQPQWIGNEIGTYNLYAKPLNIADGTGIQSSYAWTFNQNLAKYKVYSTQGDNSKLNLDADKSTLILDFETYPDVNCEDNLQESDFQNPPVFKEHHTGVSALEVGPYFNEELIISIKK